MEVVINEKSLTGQYASVDQFLSEGLKRFVRISSEFVSFNTVVLKSQEIWRCHVTKEIILQKLLASDLSRQYDLLRKFKSQLARLINDPPFWEACSKQNPEDSFMLCGKDVSNSSLAEAAVRDCIVASFDHPDFAMPELEVFRNSSPVIVQNIIRENQYTELLRRLEKIEFKDYINEFFKNTNINFSFVEEKNGFNLIGKSDEDTFLSSFLKFTNSTWDQIIKDNSFSYRTYHDQSIFSSYKQRIDKFSISRKYRCYGFRKEDIFYVVRFELDHKLSE